MYIYVYIYIYIYTCVYIYIYRERERERYSYIHTGYWSCASRSTLQGQITANFRTNIMDFRGFDSSIVLTERGEIPKPIGNLSESLSQAILAGTILAGRLGVGDNYCTPDKSTPQKSSWMFSGIFQTQIHVEVVCSKGLSLVQWIFTGIVQWVFSGILRWMFTFMISGV